MEKQPTISPALKDCNHRLCSTLQQYISLLNELIAIIMKHESVKGVSTENTIPDSVEPVVSIMLQALGSSSNTLYNLSGASGLHTRDCYSIVRSIVELSVNICYIIAEGPDAAGRASRHARQKSYKNLERASKINNTIIKLNYSGRPDPSKIEGLEKDIAEFTAQTGRDKGWIDLNIDKRIEVVGEKLSTSTSDLLHFARFMIYRDSSEILHGTYFGALYFFGITKPNPVTTQDEWMEFIGEQHMEILFATLLSHSAVVRSFHKAYGLPHVYEKSRALDKTVHEIPYFQGDSPI